MAKSRRASTHWLRRKNKGKSTGRHAETNKSLRRLEKELMKKVKVIKVREVGDE